ncbi:hypothetical protein T492DRAFT_858777 [Pavlovales sp. CCMP2436]|nr:hypothetical protein T492DRAFT_858777 [Pavlovales sp. CCMP2436]
MTAVAPMIEYMTDIEADGGVDKCDLGIYAGILQLGLLAQLYLLFWQFLGLLVLAKPVIVENSSDRARAPYVGICMNTKVAAALEGFSMARYTPDSETLGF